MSRTKRTTLTMADIKDVLDKEILIGSDMSLDGYRVTFAFKPLDNKFVVCHDNYGVVAAGWASDVHELLKTYNEL